MSVEKRVSIRSLSTRLRLAVIIAIVAGLSGLTVDSAPPEAGFRLITGQHVASGARITPTAAPGSFFRKAGS